MEQRFFQWLVGERRGEVLVFDRIEEESDGTIYIVFKDKSRINESLVLSLNQVDATNKMMAEVENMSKLWQFKESIVGEESGRVEQDWESQIKYDVPSITEIMSDGQKMPVKKKKIDLIPPPRTRPEIVKSKFGVISNPPPAPIVPPPVPVEISSQVHQSTLDKNDPVFIMMDKSKKIDTEVDMTLTISLPTQSLFDVVKDSFDDGNKKGLEYIIESIDISKIKKALKEGINQMYNPKTPEEAHFEEYSNYTPECIEEPIISDPKPPEIMDEIDLKEK